MGIMGVQYKEEKRHMAKDIIQDLQDGLCLVRFRSLKSNKEKEIEATLNPEHIPNRQIVNQSNETEKILMYNCTFEKWEDIDKETLLGWIKL